jgi:plasmid stabilization system protein ParE
MKVVFSPRALGNIQQILADTERRFDIGVAESLEKRLSRAFEQIGRTPESAPRAPGRSHVHALLLTGYPFWFSIVFEPTRLKSRTFDIPRGGLGASKGEGLETLLPICGSTEPRKIRRTISFLRPWGAAHVWPISTEAGPERRG